MRVILKLMIKIFKALANQKRLNILKILCSKPMSAPEVHSEYCKRFETIKHREIIYNYLEQLLKAGLLEKYYDSEQKCLMYKLKNKQLIIDFCKM